MTSAIESALDVVFSASKKRNFLHSRLLGIAIIFIFAILFSIPTVAQITESTLISIGFHFPISALTTGKIFFFVTSFVAYLIAITIIPNQKIDFKHAVIGGLIFAPGILVARGLFQWFMVHGMSKYNLIYGSLTAAVVLIMWIYYLAMVLLISAEFVAGLQKNNGTKKH